MRIQPFTLGRYGTDCYIAYGDGRCTVIDAPYPMDAAIAFLKDSQLIPDDILLTHGHFDHIFGLAGMKAAFPEARIYLAEEDMPFIEDGFRRTRDMLRYLDPGFLDGIDLSSFPAGILPYSSYDGCFEIMKTPGHTMGSVSIYSSEEGILFSGDTLFALGVGRTDLGGDFSLLSQSLHRLMELDGRTIVLPGHGPSTSISRERVSNPYL